MKTTFEVQDIIMAAFDEYAKQLLRNNASPEVLQRNRFIIEDFVQSADLSGLL